MANGKWQMPNGDNMGPGAWPLGLSKTVILCALLLLFAVSAFSAAFVDDVGRTVKIKPPVKRIVCLSPAHTEMFFWLGAEGTLVAVSKNCDYPEGASRLPKAGDFMHPDLEKIVELKPDLVISGGGVQKNTIKALEELDVPVMVMYPKGAEDIAANMRVIAEITGAISKKWKDIMKFEREIFKSGKSKASVYMELWNNPAMGVGGKSFISDVLQITGGKNIFADAKTEYPKVSKEEILKRDPEVIILLYDPEDEYKNRDYISGTTAGETGRVYVLNKEERDLILRPGPRMLEGKKLLEKLLGD